MKCHKCKCTDKKLIHHHKSYNPEIIVMMCMSCHKKLHAKLRREGTCQIPTDELEKLSHSSKHSKNRECVYHKNNCDQIEFTKTVMLYVQLRECLRYNYKTGNVSYWTGFRATGSKKLYYIDAKV